MLFETRLLYDRQKNLADSAGNGSAYAVNDLSSEGKRLHILEVLTRVEEFTNMKGQQTTAMHRTKILRSSVGCLELLSHVAQEIIKPQISLSSA